MKSCLLGVAMMATVAALLSPETTIAARRLADTGAGSSPAPLSLGYWGSRDGLLTWPMAKGLKLFGITYLLKIKFKLLFQGPLAK